MSRIIVDADACPQQVRRIIEKKCRAIRVNLLYVTDRNHLIESDIGQVVMVDQGHDAVDMAIINQTQPGDLVITQDYGLASLVLAKGALSLHPSGREYRPESIDYLLMDRHLAAKSRRTGERGPRHKKRDRNDDYDFEKKLDQILSEIKQNETYLQRPL